MLNGTKLLQPLCPPGKVWLLRLAAALASSVMFFKMLLQRMYSFILVYMLYLMLRIYPWLTDLCVAL